jgi:hypothetical protein
VKTLRGGIEEDSRQVVSPEQLDKAAQVVFERVQQKKSYVRMLHQWQAAGGLSFVANTHNTGMLAFLTVGDAAEGRDHGPVSLGKFQACIRNRHEVSTASGSGSGSGSATRSAFEEFV